MTKIDEVLAYFDEILPNASCELEYTSDYSFLFAVMLSAQATDKGVNKVTKILFEKYKSLNEIALANEAELIKIVMPVGLGKNKGHNIIETAKVLLEKYNGKVPNDFGALVNLPGVGIKTANVVRCELFKEPSVPVDTHVARISKRLGFAKKDDDVLTIEKKLEKLIEPNRQIKAHHQFIHFGRYFCKAKNPDCQNCKIKQHCKEKF